MECTIRNLREEIKQPHNPFVNLSQQGICCLQVNAFKAMIQDLELDSDTLPHGSNDIGDSYVFLRARDKTACFVDGVVSAALQKFYEEQGFGNFDND